MSVERPQLYGDPSAINAFSGFVRDRGVVRATFPGDAIEIPQSIVRASSVVAQSVVADTYAVQSVIADTIEARENISLWTSQGGGWRDMIGQINARTVGPGNPTWGQMGASPFFAYRFDVNDTVWIPAYHIQHDYAPGTDILLHAHWTTDGADLAAVNWEFTYTCAKGHNQQNFNMAGTTVTTTEAGQGTAWRHMLSEIAVAIASPDFEPDGVIMTRVRRITNGGVDNGDDVFLIVADCHYQVNAFATKNNKPNFYGP